MRLSFLDRLRAALRREKADVTEAWQDAKDRLDADMDRREADLAATPEDKLADIQADIDAHAGDLDEIRRKIDGPGPGE